MKMSSNKIKRKIIIDQYGKLVQYQRHSRYKKNINKYCF